MMLTKRPGLSSSLRLGYMALTAIIRVSTFTLGSMAYTLAENVCEMPSTVKLIGYPTVICPAYFSETENSIFSGLIFTSCTILVWGVA